MMKEHSPRSETNARMEKAVGGDKRGGRGVGE